MSAKYLRLKNSLRLSYSIASKPATVQRVARPSMRSSLGCVKSQIASIRSNDSCSPMRGILLFNGNFLGQIYGIGGG